MSSLVIARDQREIRARLLVIHWFFIVTLQGDEESGIFFFQSRALMIDHHFRVKKIAPLLVASRISWNSVDPLPYI